MIIGKKFAWGHIPRTGGDITAELFQYANRLFDGQLIERMDGPANLSKHYTFKENELKADGAFILNIRKLPSFILSWVIMCSGRLRTEDKKCFQGGVWPYFYETLPVPTKKQLLDPCEAYGPPFFHKHYGRSFATLPDDLLKKYTDGYFINFWIRLERLKEDFIRAVELVEKLNEQQKEKIMQYQYTVKSPFAYNHNVKDFFSESELRTLYENNPLWCEIERKTYE